MFSETDIEILFSLTIIDHVTITTQKFVNKVGTKFYENAAFNSKYVFENILIPWSLIRNVSLITILETSFP